VNHDEEVEKIKNDILNYMTSVEDPAYRSILSLMSRMMSANLRLTQDMIEKLDTVIKDEKRIKDIVLNGHVENHRRHHDWLEHNLMKKDNLHHVIKLAEGHREQGVYCQWAADKMKEEKESRSKFKDRYRGLIEKIIIGIIFAIIGFNMKILFPHIFN